MAKLNAQIMLRCATVYPFRLRGKSLLCVFCHDQFTEPDEFRSHMTENHQKFNMNTAFAHSSRGYKNYLKVDCSKITCKICNAPYEILEDVAVHVKNDHDCTKLNLEYDIGLQPYRLNKDKFDCYICNEKLASLTTLCRHTALHYLKYTCDTCGKSYISNEALKYHMKFTHSDGFSCRKCRMKFASAEKKSEHLRESERCRPFCCIICGERFLSWDLKQKHQVTEHGQQPITYDCPECNESFNKRRLYYRHFKLHHTDNNYTCAGCGVKFCDKHRLEDHKICHTGEKMYRCSICDKSFSRSKSLKQHLWVHSETKRFICPVCNKQFAQNVSLQGHMKSRHPNVETLQ